MVGIVANLRPVKDHALFLHSAKLANQIPDAAFLLAGRGELYDDLRKLAAELGIGDRVFFTQGEGNMMDWLSRMAIGCLSSISEGFSNAIMEYMAAGMPVVAIDVGGNRDAVVDGETGYLVPQRSPEKFAEPIIKLLRNDELRASMGAKGFERCLPALRGTEDDWAAGRLLQVDAARSRLVEHRLAQNQSEPGAPRANESGTTDTPTIGINKGQR